MDVQSLSCAACEFTHCSRDKFYYDQMPSASRNLGMNTLLLVILILLILGTLPTWPYSSNWGYAPSGGLGTILVILVVLALMGRI